MSGLRCPRCQTRMVVHEISKKIRCPGCEFVPEDRTMRAASFLEGMDSIARLRGTTLRLPGDLPLKALNRYREGEASLRNGDHDAARAAFLAALEEQPDFIEAHLHMSQLEDDPIVQAGHINAATEYERHHPRAVFLAARLVANGRLDPPVSSEMEEPDEEAALLEDLFANEPPTHQVRCEACRTRRTRPVRKLPDMCPLCGHARPVVEPIDQDDFHPNSLVPLRVPRKNAASVIKQQITSLPDEVRQRVALDVMYFPYWVFDVTHDSEQPVQSSFRIPAARTPLESLPNKFPKTDASEAFDYAHLEKIPALLPDIPFEKALHRTRKHLAESEQAPANVGIVGELMLHPLWVATIPLRGEVRLIVVDGASGRVFRK